MTTTTQAKPAAKTQTQHYQVWTYDVWGNEEEGYQVNDRYKGQVVTLKVKAEICNQGTEYEFASYYPTDRQIASVFGCKASEIEVEGEAEYTLYINESDRYYPIGELERLNSKDN